MSTYLLVDITVHDPEQFAEYVQKARPLVEKHGGVYRVRGGDVTVKEGTWSPQRLVVVEFPSREHVDACLADPEYQPVVAIRHAAATSNMIVVDGYEPD